MVEIPHRRWGQGLRGRPLKTLLHFLDGLIAIKKIMGSHALFARELELLELKEFAIEAGDKK